MRNFLIAFSIWLFATNFNVLAQTFNLKRDFGAKGDGVTDDSEAWGRAIAHMNKTKSGELYVPKGTYIIGAQVKNINNKYTNGKYDNIINDAKNMRIYGDVDNTGRPTSKLKYKKGFYFGYFNSKGVPVNKSDKNSLQAHAGFVISIRGKCNNVAVENLELDGNIQNANIGKDHSHNFMHIGVYLLNITGVTLRNLNIHHFGLDGVYIEALHNGNKNNVLLDKVICDYNGRQGLSFTIGQGLVVKNSKFRYTGRGGLLLSPGANVDIENHTLPGRFLEDVTFENSELIDNAGGSGSLNLAGDIRRFKMKNCKIETTNWLAIQSNFSSSRDFYFQNCSISGSVDFQIYRAEGRKGNEITIFEDCIISDNKNNREVGLSRSLINVYDNVHFKNCQFKVWSKRPLLHSYANSKSDNKSKTVVFDKCTFSDIESNAILSNKIERLTKTPNRIQIK